MGLAERHDAAKKYKPEKVKLLLVAEAPPCDRDRYFYFEKVNKHDWLFRYVWEGLTGEKPDRDEKASHLASLRDAGVFLIDLHEGNISKPKLSDLEPCVPGLVERCKGLKPKHIVLIKHSVYDAAYEALKAAKLPVIDAKLPFPTSGQQRKFLVGFREAVEPVGISIPMTENRRHAESRGKWDGKRRSTSVPSMCGNAPLSVGHPIRLPIRSKRCGWISASPCSVRMSSTAAC